MKSKKTESTPPVPSFAISTDFGIQQKSERGHDRGKGHVTVDRKGRNGVATARQETMSGSIILINSDLKKEVALFP